MEVLLNTTGDLEALQKQIEQALVVGETTYTLSVEELFGGNDFDVTLNTY